MSIHYITRPRKNLNNPEAPTKFHPILISQGRESFSGICERVAQNNSMSKGEFMHALEDLIREIAWQLANGKIVDLETFGVFWTVAHTAGVENEADVTAALIKKIIVKYRASKFLQDMVNNATLEKHKPK